MFLHFRRPFLCLYNSDSVFQDAVSAGDNVIYCGFSEMGADCVIGKFQLRGAAVKIVTVAAEKACQPLVEKLKCPPAVEKSVEIHGVHL